MMIGDLQFEHDGNYYVARGCRYYPAIKETKNEPAEGPSISYRNIAMITDKGLVTVHDDLYDAILNRAVDYEDYQREGYYDQIAEQIKDRRLNMHNK